MSCNSTLNLSQNKDSENPLITKIYQGEYSKLDESNQNSSFDSLAKHMKLDDLDESDGRAFHVKSSTPSSSPDESEKLFNFSFSEEKKRREKHGEGQRKKGRMASKLKKIVRKSLRKMKRKKWKHSIVDQTLRKLQTHHLDQGK